MEHFLHNTSPQTVDDDVQPRHTPASQPFRAHQPFQQAQSFFYIDQAINNQFSHLADSTYQEILMGDYESIATPQMGELDSLIQPLMMQQPTQPMIGPQSMPQPSHSMSHSGVNHSLNLNSENMGFMMNPFEEIVPFTSGDFGTMTLAPSLQQPAFKPSVILPQRWPPNDNTISVEQDISLLALKQQIPFEYQAQHPPRVARPPARKRAPKTATMTAQKWGPAERRIRQLFLDEKRSYRDLMKIVNTEFEFGAK